MLFSTSVSSSFNEINSSSFLVYVWLSIRWTFVVVVAVVVIAVSCGVLENIGFLNPECKASAPT